MTIEVDRGAIARAGLCIQEVQDVVEIALGGATAGEVIEGDRQLELVVRLPGRLRNDIETIGSTTEPG